MRAAKLYHRKYRHTAGECTTFCFRDTEQVELKCPLICINHHSPVGSMASETNGILAIAPKAVWHRRLRVRRSE